MESTLKSNIKKRIDWIDLTKGFAILLLIFAHCMEYYSVENGIKIFLLPLIYSFHVPLFFFVSGFLFNPSKQKNFFELLKKILKTIILPYITFAVIYTLFDAVKIYVFHTQGDVSVLGDIKSFAIQKHYTTIWFLASLFIVEIAAYFICKLKNQYIMIIAVAFICCGMIYIRYVDEWLPWCLDTVIFALPFFLAAYVIRTSEISEKIFSVKFLPLYIGLGLVSVVLNLKLSPDLRYVHMWSMQYGIIPLFYAGAFFNSFSAIIVCRLISKINYINYIGKNSLVYFGLHNLVLNVIFHFLNQISHDTIFLYIVFCAVSLILTVLLMTIVNEIFIKTPLCVLIGKKYIKRRKINENN